MKRARNLIATLAAVVTGLATTVVATASPLSISTTNTPHAGVLDASFGQRGFTLLPHQPYSVNDVRQSTNGAILVAVDFAGIPGAIGSFGLARLLPTGAVDGTFGTGGITVAPFSSGFNVAVSTATQSDGKIVAAGFSDSLPPSNVDTMAVARFLPNGELDTSFGSDGRVMLSVPGASKSGAGIVVVLSNGELLIGGGASGAASGGVIVLLKPDGSTDTTFGNQGFAVTGTSDGVNGLGLQSDGKIVALAGDTAVRFLADGRPDPSTTPGTLVLQTHVGPSMLTPDERIISAQGLADQGNLADLDTQVARLFPNGTVDPAFHGPLFDFTVTNPDRFQDVPHAVALQSDGKVVVGGEGHPSISTTLFGLARLIPTGAFDTSFGRGGVTTSAVIGSAQLGALGLQGDGKILAAGLSLGSRIGLVVARYLSQ